ncbi:MAG TPA: alpha/beta fold hydrolase [Casimicrobiaceae bacterium]|nr:alpha/beta fold hydrolase [Casimicrobiaceae bacterium]
MHPPLAPEHIDAPHRVAALGPLALESGEKILDYGQSYVTHGALDAARSNAIVVCASLTGTHHRLDFLIGPGKALDSSRYFIIATDAIGNGLSTSPSNSRAQPGMRFPCFTVRDMVHAQYRLLTEHLGVTRVHAVVGASMGGMQALQWATSHPRFMQRIVAMTAMAKTAPWAAAVTSTARACLMADRAWTGERFDGVPERGWRAYAGLMSGLLMRTPEAIDAAAASGSQAAHDDLHARQRAQGFDATDYLYQSSAYDAHDVGTTAGFGGNTRAALASIVAKVLLLAPPLDLFNPVESARRAGAVIPGARFVEIPSIQGHAAAANAVRDDSEFIDREIAQFLAD